MRHLVTSPLVSPLGRAMIQLLAKFQIWCGVTVTDRSGYRMTRDPLPEAAHTGYDFMRLSKEGQWKEKEKSQTVEVLGSGRSHHLKGLLRVVWRRGRQRRSPLRHAGGRKATWVGCRARRIRVQGQPGRLPTGQYLTLAFISTSLICV